ncbi:hemerythrin domain-containing protein [Actinomadura livida]|uniref:Hemerythrin domain-containing protein n=1 Tax=Actinomadura livida TaxID=79909 RepID=A0A7W7MW89_9ACTN|nr:MULTISPECIES: hemerythrin domain-containing protein [Actinomadura]MBB4772594.1 hemerythrin superfamily protein [Actinomadura catellatispora]GGU11518.1 hemerythrin [Actinomadura livida]
MRTTAANTEKAATEKTEARKTDAAKTDAAKTDAAKTDAAKTDAAKTEDVIDLLRAQHGRIRDLFDEVMHSAGTERRDAFRELVRLLAVHETAEEEIVHPVARRLPGGKGIVADRLAEERAAKELLSELHGMDTDDPAFLKSLDKLRMDVLSHARAEERYEFDRLRDQFSPTQLRGFAAAVRAAEAIAPTRPHPGTESAAKNMLLGPPVAVLDRVRDMIRSARDGG